MKRAAAAGISLAKAFRIVTGDVVSFVGGGGKTTSMFRLAEELSAAGFRVVVTTSTHIAEDQVHLGPAYITPEELHTLGTHLDRHGQCLVAGRPDGKGRVFTIAPEVLYELKRRSDIDCLLIEADGSKSRPFKAPAAHEPVVPDFTTVLVPIAGMDSLGKHLDEATVHRPEIVASLADAETGCLITPEMIARVLAHPGGGAKNIPLNARLMPLLNKADTCDPKMSRRVAEELLKFPKVDTVLIGTVNRHPPVIEAWVPTAGIIPTQGRDPDSVLQTARAALEAGLDPVLIMAGSENIIAAEALSRLPIQIVKCPANAGEHVSYIRTGMEALPARVGAVMVFHAGLSGIDAGLIAAGLKVQRKTLAPLCVPLLNDQGRNLLLVGRELFPELRDLRDSEGIDGLLEKHRGRAKAITLDRA